MLDAEVKGYTIGSFPISEYESHLSGANWCVPKTIWYNDHDVILRPFVTFIATNPIHFSELAKQADHDFDILPLGNRVVDSVIIHDGAPKKDVDNRLYDLRFRAKGEYVCLILENVEKISSNYVAVMREEVVKLNYPDEFVFGGLRIVKRKKWQYEDCLYNKF
jgi:hypothetical protein